ncbi:MAG: hypothetical protein Q7Q73_04380 [Verrucomicrobiota bacterium JB024]|nr:hypothetical protein [Verrucomicrobiota bacterium JB024]
MSNTAPETSHSNYLFSIFGALGSMLLFFIIILIAYVYMQRPAPVNQQIVDNRLAKLADVTAKETALTTEYAWVDQKAGVVRVPVDLAMQLAVKEIAAKPEGIFPAAAAAPAPAADAPAADAKPAEGDAAQTDSATGTADAAKDKPAADAAAQPASGEGAQEAK